MNELSKKLSEEFWLTFLIDRIEEQWGNIYYLTACKEFPWFLIEEYSKKGIEKEVRRYLPIFLNHCYKRLKEEYEENEEELEVLRLYAESEKELKEMYKETTQTPEGVVSFIVIVVVFTFILVMILFLTS